MPVGRTPTATPRDSSRGRFLDLSEPGLAPLERSLFRHDAGRGVVHVALADTPRAELRKDLVEALAAEVEGFRVGPIAEAKHAVAHSRQIWPSGFQVLIQRPGVVRVVALAVGRGA